MNTKIPKFILDNPSGLIEELEPKDGGAYLTLICPACNRREAFIYKGSDRITCNRRNNCAYSISLTDYIKETNDLTEDRVLDFILQSYGNPQEIISYEDRQDEQIEEKTVELPEGINYFSGKESFIEKRAFNYLVNRNIPKKNIKDLGYIFEPGSFFHETIFIPFYENKNIVYFVCRDYTNKKTKKYLNPKGINSKLFVYNLDKIEENGVVFIFEGLMNVLALESQVGTAMLSADLGKNQAIKICSKIPKTVVFVPDNDEAGRRSLKRNINLFMRYKPPSLDIEIFVYLLEDAEDFNATGRNYISLQDCLRWRNNVLLPLKERLI